MYFSVVFFCYQAPNSPGATVVNLVYTYLTRGTEDPVWVSSRDRRSRWCHLSIIPGTTPHCLVSTEGNVNFLGTRKLVYWGRLDVHLNAYISRLSYVVFLSSVSVTRYWVVRAAWVAIYLTRWIENSVWVRLATSLWYLALSLIWPELISLQI